MFLSLLISDKFLISEGIASQGEKINSEGIV